MISLFAAVVTTGLMAGLFTCFSYAIMPGLGRSDNRAFVQVMQHINVAILNGWFLLCFVGALVFPAMATLLYLGEDDKAPLPWMLAGLVLYLVVLGITRSVNIPLNDELMAAGEPAANDVRAVRERFERRWVSWNLARAIASLGAFSCLTWALFQYGQVT